MKKGKPKIIVVKEHEMIKISLAGLLSVIICAFLMFTSGCSKDNNDKPKTVFNPELSYSQLFDKDSNAYKTITIGHQTWMAENLKVTKYNDGTAILNVTDALEWDALNIGAYCNYENLESNDSIYGRLYNWHAVNSGKLCPKGWHVPTNADWDTLINFVGGDSLAGGKLKATAFWVSPNSWADNSSGFSALPGGRRYNYGLFSAKENYGYWWSSSYRNSRYAWFYYLCYNSRSVSKNYRDKSVGFSVRCIKDK
jgi:uncharacterized protein (TIGR02145 family)